MGYRMHSLRVLYWKITIYR